LKLGGYTLIMIVIMGSNLVVSKGNFVSFFSHNDTRPPKIKNFQNLSKNGKKIQNSTINDITWDQTGNIFMVTGSGE